MADFLELPDKPYFNCTEAGLAVLDADQVKRDISSLPLFVLKVGAGNLLEQRPLKASGQSGEVVVVQCEGGSTLRLDFEDDVATKSGPDGDFRYRGGIGDGNDGLGFMPS